MHSDFGPRDRRRPGERLPDSYRRYADLGRDTRLLAESLPADIDLVVGLRGSGTLAASLLSLHLGVPMETLARLQARGVVGDDTGTTDADAAVDTDAQTIATDAQTIATDALTTDIDTRRTETDTAADGATPASQRSTGGRLAEEYADSRRFGRGGRVVVVAATDYESDLDTAREAFQRTTRPLVVAYASVYVADANTDRVDYYGAVVERSCLFEWSLLHHPVVEDSCFDIDGVLCRDPTPEENDDGKRYEEFLRTVEPLALPTRRVGWLVTSRLEQYRDETEAWLDRHDVRYDELVMMDHASAAERRAAGNHGAYKADVYASVDAPLFVESDPKQAAEIARSSGKPALSYGTNELLAPGDTADGRAPRAGYLDRLTRHPVPFLSLAVRHVVGRCSRTLRRAEGQH